MTPPPRRAQTGPILLLLSVAAILSVVTLACNANDKPPHSPGPAAPAIQPTELASVIQDAVQAAIQTALAPTPGTAETATPTPRPSPTPVPLEQTALSSAIQTAVAPKPRQTPAIPTVPAPSPTPWGWTAGRGSPTPTPIIPVVPTYTPKPRPAATQTPRPYLYPTKAAVSPLRNFQNGRWLATTHPAAYQSLASLPWVADGMNTTEADTVQNLIHIGYYQESALQNALTKSWIKDGINTTEARAIDEISHIGHYQKTVLHDILAMPFLASITPGDLEALESLADTARQSTGTLQEILTHPTLAGGITDGWTPVVATLESPARQRPSLIAELLNPAVVTLEERTITLPLAGEVRLAIIRTTQNNQPQTMDHLENGVREAERFMQEPFPASMAAVLFAETVTPGFAGANYGSHIASLPKLEDYSKPYKISEAAKHMAHEVAHYYWAGHNNWVDEGMANLMEAVAEHRRAGQPIEPHRYPCPQANSLAKLDSMDPDKADPAFLCNYSLGERLFIHLHQQAGDARFREAAAALYLTYRKDNEVTASDAAATFASIGLEDTFHDIYQNGIGILSPDLHPTWELPELNATITGIWVAQQDCQSPISNDSVATHTAQQTSLFLCLKYEYQTSQTLEVEAILSEQHDDGFIYQRRPIQLQAKPGYIAYTIGYGIGPGSGKPWKPGLHTFRITGPRNTQIAALELAVNP